MEQSPQSNHTDAEVRRSVDSLRVPLRIWIASQHHELVMALALLDEIGVPDIIDEAIEHYFSNRPETVIYQDTKADRVLGPEAYHDMLQAKLILRADIFELLTREVAQINLLSISDLFDIILHQYTEHRISDPMLPVLVEEARRKQQERFTQSYRI